MGGIDGERQAVGRKVGGCEGQSLSGNCGRRSWGVRWQTWGLVMQHKASHLMALFPL